MNRVMQFIGFAILIAFLLSPANVLGAPRVVDCGKGQSIQHALESAKGSAANLEIIVTGYCDENLSISRDRVAIDGQGVTTINGTITMFGRNNVTIRNLDITGPGEGIRIFGGRVRLLSVNFLGNDEIAIQAQQDAAVVLRDSFVQRNKGLHAVLLRGSHADIGSTEVSRNADNGVVATDGSTLLMSGGNVSFNVGTGVQVTGNSSFSIDGTQIHDNDNMGLFLGSGSSGEAMGATINNNRSEGIFVSENSFINVFDSVIRNNTTDGMLLKLHSSARLVGVDVYSNIENGVRLEFDSGLLVEGGSTIPRNLSGYSILCDSDESSLAIDDSSTVVDPECTAF